MEEKRTIEKPQVWQQTKPSPSLAQDILGSPGYRLNYKEADSPTVTPEMNYPGCQSLSGEGNLLLHDRSFLAMSVSACLGIFFFFF